VLPKLSTLLKLAKALDANINLNPNQESIIKIESNKMINNEAGLKHPMTTILTHRGNGFYMDDYVFKLRLIKQETTDL